MFSPVIKWGWIFESPIRKDIFMYLFHNKNKCILDIALGIDKKIRDVKKELQNIRSHPIYKAMLTISNNVYSLSNMGKLYVSLFIESETQIKLVLKKNLEKNARARAQFISSNDAYAALITTIAQYIDTKEITFFLADLVTQFFIVVMGLQSKNKELKEALKLSIEITNGVLQKNKLTLPQLNKLLTNVCLYLMDEIPLKELTSLEFDIVWLCESSKSFLEKVNIFLKKTQSLLPCTQNEFKLYLRSFPFSLDCDEPFLFFIPPLTIPIEFKRPIYEFSRLEAKDKLQFNPSLALNMLLQSNIKLNSFILTNPRAPEIAKKIIKQRRYIMGMENFGPRVKPLIGKSTKYEEDIGMDKWSFGCPIGDLDIRRSLERYGTMILGVTSLRKLKSRENPKERFNLVSILVDASTSMFRSGNIEIALECTLGLIYAAKKLKTYFTVILFGESEQVLVKPSKEYGSTLEKLMGFNECLGPENFVNPLDLALKYADKDHKTLFFLITDSPYFSYTQKMLVEIRKKGKLFLFSLSEYAFAFAEDLRRRGIEVYYIKQDVNNLVIRKRIRSQFR
jgi:hypothetical protein